MARSCPASGIAPEGTGTEKWVVSKHASKCVERSEGRGLATWALPPQRQAPPCPVLLLQPGPRREPCGSPSARGAGFQKAWSEVEEKRYLGLALCAFLASPPASPPESGRAGPLPLGLAGAWG